MIKNIKESKAMLLEEIVVYEVSYAYLDELVRKEVVDIPESQQCNL